jgi:SAM-dependent methyltransferase
VPLERDVEAQYYASRHFDSEHARDVRRHYLPFVEGRELLVELGCGRGEFIGLARDGVRRVRGVDRDPEMVKLASTAGLDVVESDVLEYLSTTDDRPDAVFAAHLIEHLSVDATFELLQAIARVMRPTGVLILVTPNPACLAMLTADFWSDPTHVRPYTVELMQFLLEESGFDISDLGGNPNDVPGPPPDLLTANTLTPWGSLADGFDSRVIPDQKKTDELSIVSREVAAIRHVLGEVDGRLSSLRHFATHIADRLNDTLHFLYPANEIYVVGRRQA